MIDPTHTLVSEATEDRLGRAEFEWKRAAAEFYDAWLAYYREKYAREKYAREEMATAKAEEQEEQ